jgi:hypothetical protein
MRQELRRCRNPFGTCNVPSRPLMLFLVYIYTLAHFKCSVCKNPFEFLYEATKHELHVSEMTISKNASRVLKVTYFEIIVRPQTSTLKLKVCMLKF